MRKKTILIVTVFFVGILAFFNKVYAYETDNYISEDGKILQFVTYNADKVKSSFESKGYKLLKNGFVMYDKINASSIKQQSIKQIESWGIKYNGGQDYYQSAWYSGDNDLKKLDDPFPSYMFLKQTSRRNFIQWTYNKKMYIAWIYCNYSTTSWGSQFTVHVYTNDTINKELYDKAEAERQEEQRKAYENAWKTVPGLNDEYTKIVNYVLSDMNYNEAKGMKKLASTDDGIAKLKKWQETIGTHNGDREGTAKGYITKLIEANKNTDKINEVTQQYKEPMTKIGSKMYTAAGEERNKTVFTDDVLKDISKYDPSQDPMDNNSSNRIETATSKILTVISNVGMAVAVIMLAILGIKYMLGSVEEKAEYKEGLIPYVIGAFILFGITSFVKILMVIGNQIGNLS